MVSKINIYAYFLPQFYPTPENDKHWGKGFTEWNNVKKAKPLFRNHQQPICPTKFGYYDLSDLGSFKSICEYAQNYDVNGFAYWHYWFGDDFQTLEKIPESHLADSSIEQNFFLSWANSNWTKSWVGRDDTVIFKQKYILKDVDKHFNYIRKFFEDERYIRLDGKPLFQVLKPFDSACIQYIRKLEELMQKTYNSGIYWIFPSADNELFNDLNYKIAGFPPGDVLENLFMYRVKRKAQVSGFSKLPAKCTDQEYLKGFLKENKKQIQTIGEKYIVTLLSGWDNTPRYGQNGYIMGDSINGMLEGQVKVFNQKIRPHYKNDFILIKAWNEWAEGNILEPYSTPSDQFNPVELLRHLNV
ncbi:MAG: glycoside hydrolase family 99-like domain-containing protein [Cyclobacteriaceae bacterium]